MKDAPESAMLIDSSETGSSVTDRRLTLALAGNVNVGKSTIFNQLTGLAQETGNWGGKTVEVKKGTLYHHGLQIDIVDLPGIYSFATYSPEEQITHEYILTQSPDVIINVVDATSLERNLFFTLQLKEMGQPVVLVLNYNDIARKKSINIDTGLLGELLGVPVVDTIAIKGIGVHEFVDKALELLDKSRSNAGKLKYGTEVEQRIDKVIELLNNASPKTASRWLAIQLLEGKNPLSLSEDEKISAVVSQAEKLTGELVSMHGEDISTIISAERYALAASITEKVSSRTSNVKKFSNILDNITLHPVFGYFLFFLTLAAILFVVSLFGEWVTGVIEGFFESFKPEITGPAMDIFWNGGVIGFYAALIVAIGFILPFFLILSWLSESGYLPRIAFLMDRPCHTLGLHGMSSIPLIMALGCNVPACMACRVMNNKRDRLLATFLTTMVPCAARTSIVLGLVGAFIGWQWAVGVLFFQFLLIYLIGLALNKIMPSTSPGIIMEIPEYRWPSLKNVWRQAWLRFKEFLVIGVPLIVIGSIVIEALNVFNWLDYITDILAPVTVSWLGLPAFTGVLLIFGILRKEANLALLISFAGGAAITTIMTPLQMVVFTIVILIYIPCISTIAVLLKETGIKVTALMVLAEIGLAILIGGIAYRLLGLFL
ncbi:MAG: ferrous iron transport protein B [Dehalococcoidales bacterium]|nr:ferrous iron transport protein B [Dehalococcoidales bacterium]